MISMIKKYKRKFDALSPVAKSSVALVFAKFFQKGLSMISGPIFTRIMPASEYGLYSTFAAFQDLLTIVVTLDMSSGIFNNGMLDFREDRDSFVFSIMCLANVCTILWGGIYVLFYQWLSPVMGMPDILMFIMFFYLLSKPAYNFWVTRQRYEYKYKALTLVTLITSLASTLFAIGLVLLSPDNYKAIAKIMASELIAIVAGFVCCIYIIYRAKAKLVFSYWKYALRYSLPLIPHFLSMYLLSSSDRIMITKLAGTESTAIYNVAYTVASIILIFWNSVDSAYAPWIYQKLDEKKVDAIKRRGNQLLLLFAAMSLMAMLFAPEIIGILAPEEYKTGIYVVPSVAAGVFFTACYSLYVRVELFLKKTKIVMTATCFAAGLNLILNYIFIKPYGFIAAGYTTLLCYAILALFHGVNLKRLGYGYVYDNKAIIALSFAMILASFITIFTYRWFVLRYLLIGILAGILYKNRKNIIAMMKRKNG